MSSNILLVLSGPSGAGKSTLVKMVLEAYPDFTYSVSATTRPPRPGEENGKDYFFVSEEEFKEMMERGELLEWAHVYGMYYYGTPRRFIERTLEHSSIIIDVDVQGGLQIMERFPDAVFVFIKTKDIATLEERLRKRGDVPPAELESRLKTAREEMKYADRYDHVITNTSLSRAFAELRDIIDRSKGAPA